MDSPTLFVGLVTHKGSRFDMHGEARRTVDAIEAAMTSFAVPCTSLISDRDDYSSVEFPLTRARLAASAAFQAWLEFRWRRYLAHARAHANVSLPRDGVVLAAMAVRRLHSYLGWNPFRSAARMPGAAQVIRLLNIDLSHLRVYRAALESHAGAILVIEDDARIRDHSNAFTVLKALLDRLRVNNPEFVNLSESLSLQELGVSGIVGQPESCEGVFDAQVCRCLRPVTNTVCAVLFSRSCVEQLVADIDRRELWPVIPIDWRLNRMILDGWKSGDLNSTSCTWISPGIFVQGSMHNE